MTIVRVGLSEHRKYAEGWEAIFGKKKNNKSGCRTGRCGPTKKTAKKSTAKKAKK